MADASAALEPPSASHDLPAVREGFDPDTEAAEAIASSTEFFAAYPYVRELFQSSTVRLQIDPRGLGMLLAESTQPAG